VSVESAAGRKGRNVITVRPAPEWLAMLRAAKVDLLAYDGAPCSEVAGSLASAVRRIEDGLETYRGLAAAGGEVEFDSVVDMLRWVAERCAYRPAATLRVRARSAAA
jgi:hypothetical protein